MRLSAVAFFMILTTVFLSGCGQDNMATLDNRGQNFYGRGGVIAMNSQLTVQAVPVMNISSNTLTPPASAPAPAATPAPVAQHMAQAAPLTPGAWQWPVNGKITEKFGQQASGISNEGIVIAANAGSPIRAAQAGDVAFVGEDTRNYGNIVILRHADGEMTSYAHAQSIIVKKGDHVNGGNVIGYVGQSGNAKVPELHFAVRDGKSSIDPLTKLPQQPQQMASN
jgi:murein DD-endopeptidase MepM/ murein hydrolase activator NlpD